MLLDHPKRELEVLELWQLLFARTNLGKNIRDLKSHYEGKGTNGDA